MTIMADIFWVPIMSQVLYVLSYLILTMKQIFLFLPIFTDEETEV